MTAAIQISNSTETRVINKELLCITPFLLKKHTKGILESVKKFANTQLQPGEQIKDIAWIP